MAWRVWSTGKYLCLKRADIFTGLVTRSANSLVQGEAFVPSIEVKVIMRAKIFREVYTRGMSVWLIDLAAIHLPGQAYIVKDVSGCG